jgi:hypothetical protein
MFDVIAAVGHRLLRRANWWVVSSRRFLSLRILYRCLPGRPLYRLVPLAYLLSALLQILFTGVIAGGLVVVLLATRADAITVGALLMLVLIVRRRVGLPAMAALVGGLVLLPNASVAVLPRLLLCAANWLVGAAVWWEYRCVRSQFAFKPFYMSNINEGSAGILQGKVHVVHLFVTTSRQWEPEEQQVVLSRTSRALAWLVGQARRYGTSLSFEEHEPLECPAHPGAIPDAGSGIGSHRAFGEGLNRFLDGHLPEAVTAPGANSCLIVYVKDPFKTYSAYAVSQCRFRDSACRLEYVVAGPPHDAPVIAHELLHLFGADDFYAAAYRGPNCHEPLLRGQMLSGCIMFATGPELSQSAVDDLTAQNIGWL